MTLSRNARITGMISPPTVRGRPFRYPLYDLRPGRSLWLPNKAKNAPYQFARRYHLDWKFKFLAEDHRDVIGWRVWRIGGTIELSPQLRDDMALKSLNAAKRVKKEPKPKRHKAPSYPFASMQVGDSLVLPLKSRTSAYNFQRRHQPDWVFAFEREGKEHWRVWRIF